MNYTMVSYSEDYKPGLCWDIHEDLVKVNWSELLGTKFSFWHPFVYNKETVS